MTTLDPQLIALGVNALVEITTKALEARAARRQVREELAAGAIDMTEALRRYEAIDEPDFAAAVERGRARARGEEG